MFNPLGFPVFEAGRGGRYTYHGPGQRVGYVLLDLDRRGRDVRRFVHALEGWVIATLGDFGVEARRAPGRIGIWADRRRRRGQGRRDRRQGAALGDDARLFGQSGPELSHFSGIVPCGIADFPVTSLDEMGVPDGQERFDLALKQGLAIFCAPSRGNGEKA